MRGLCGGYTERSEYCRPQTGFSGCISGRLQNQDGIVHLKANAIQPLVLLEIQSHDFR
jgi:hypothetical protein